MSESINESSNRKRRRSRKSIQTEQEILKQAKAFFAEQGYEQATTKDIAHAAGVAEGTVFLYFDNKLGLLNGIMDDIYACLQSHVNQIAAHESDPFKRLRAFLAIHLQIVQQQRGAAR